MSWAFSRVRDIRLRMTGYHGVARREFEALEQADVCVRGGGVTAGDEKLRTCASRRTESECILNGAGEANRINMKTRINLVLMLALALTLIGATLTMATPAGEAPPTAAGPVRHLRRRRRPLRGRPQHHARAVRLLQRPALPGPAPVGRQDLGHRRRPARRVAGPGCGRIRQRGRAGRVLRQHVLLDHHHLRPIPQAQRPHPGAPRRIQRPGHGRVQQRPGRRHGADYDHGPQGLRRLHRAGHGPPRGRRRRAPRWTTRRRGSTGSSTASTTTPAAASTTATPRPTAATTTTAPWKPPTTATPLPGITGTLPARGS